MNKIFDYIFFRIYKRYEKWGENTPKLYAECFISLLYIIILLDVMLVIKLLNFEILHDFEIKPILIILSIIILFYNDIVFSKRKDNIIKYYNSNIRKSTLFDVLLVVVISMIFLFPLILGYIR